MYILEDSFKGKRSAVWSGGIAHELHAVKSMRLDSKQRGNTPAGEAAPWAGAA